MCFMIKRSFKFFHSFVSCPSMLHPSCFLSICILCYVIDVPLFYSYISIKKNCFLCYGVIKWQAHYFLLCYCILMSNPLSSFGILLLLLNFFETHMKITFKRGWDKLYYTQHTFLNNVG